MDDDNDGILDANDGCTSSLGWTSTQENDRDQDGCHDDTNDDDDDGDGILDVNDACLNGEINWPANLYNDWDQDGCNDLLEDSDDDNDGELDATDGCPKGRSNWQSERTMNTDFDMDGCYDATEDVDDDNDNVNDVNATGATLDLCPTTPANATDVDEVGCAAIERYTDSDGVNDLVDACEGTPSGLTVNTVGCADLDGDGVFANVDICAYSPARWTIDVYGCAIVQRPVQWTAGTSVIGPMDIVPTFTVPTLDGTFTFQNKWTGNDVYLFMFKYTDGSGTRIQQHGQQIRAHLFVTCLKTRTCFTARLIQVTTTMSSRERAMLKHASTQVKKNSGMAVYITSIWMQATFRAA